MKPWAEQFYNSEAWRSTRAAFLTDEHGQKLCERCATAGEVVVATIAHHKEYLTPQNIDDPQITLSADNLEALCQTCHNKEHHGSETERKYFFDEDGNIHEQKGDTPPFEKSN